MKVFTRICLSIALISIGLGIGILLLAVGRRSSLQNKPTYSLEDSVRDVRELDIRMDYGEITITQGNEFSVEASNLYKADDLESYMSDGVWVISHDTSDNFNLFGFRIPISINIGEYNNTPSIKITVPKDFHAENIKIMLNAGRLKADNLHADTGSFNVDAGSLEIEGLIIEEESSFSVGAGYISLKQIDVRDITVKCDFGSVIIEGVVTGDNKIYCDVGKITLDIEDNMDFYSFDIDSDLGNVIINNRRYRDKVIRSDSNKNKGSFLLKVDVGNITMDFSEY
jgi:hypothetical protein